MCSGGFVIATDSLQTRLGPINNGQRDEAWTGQNEWWREIIEGVGGLNIPALTLRLHRLWLYRDWDWWSRGCTQRQWSRNPFAPQHTKHTTYLKWQLLFQVVLLSFNGKLCSDVLLDREHMVLSSCFLWGFSMYRSTCILLWSSSPATVPSEHVLCRMCAVSHCIMILHISQCTDTIRLTSGDMCLCVRRVINEWVACMVTCPSTEHV